MRNNNRKVIGKLSSRNMKKNRMRNLFAIGAICLTSLLFTAVFSMGIGMGQALIPVIKDTFTFVCFAVVPFNVVKGIVISIITMLVYKHISPLLHR